MPCTYYASFLKSDNIRNRGGLDGILYVLYIVLNGRTGLTQKSFAVLHASRRRVDG